MIPLDTSGVVGVLYQLTTRMPSIKTASVFVPPTSTPIRMRPAYVLVIDFEYTRRQDVGLADEIGHEVGLRLLVHLARCTDLLDGAIPHDRDAVRHGQRLALVMCHVDGSDAQLRVEISNP